MRQLTRFCTVLCLAASVAFGCTVTNTKVSIAAAGGNKTAATPQCTTVSENVSWITSATITNGVLTLVTTSNNAAGPRYGKVRVNNKTDILVTQYGTSSPVATASVDGAPRNVPDPGINTPFRVAHHLAPLLISISPLTLPLNATADVIAITDGYFANDVVPPGSSFPVSNYPAVLTVDGSAQTFNATLTQRNELRWLNVPIGTLQQTATGTLRLRFPRLRATGTTIAFDLETTAPFVLSNADAPLIAAVVQDPGISFTKSQPVFFSDASTGQGYRITLTVAETVPTAFAAAQTNVPGTRFNVLGNLQGSGYTTYAQVQSSPTNARLVSANDRGGGGSNVAGTKTFLGVSYAENDDSVTYEVKSANDAALESFTFNIVVQGADAGTAQSVRDALRFRLSPLLLFGVDPCGTIPLSGKPSNQRSACGSQAGELEVEVTGITIVGSNRRITYSVRNTNGDDGPSTPVIVRGNAGLGYSFANCSRSDGGACSVNGDVQEATINDLAPGTTTTFTVDIAETEDVPEGTLVENIFLAESQIDEEEDRSNNLVSDTFVKQACSPLTPVNPTYGAAGGSGTVNVPNCYIWTASSNAPWITITSPAPGVETYDPGTVSYTVQANTGAAQRSGTLTIGGNLYTITQRPPCSFTVGPPSSRNVGNGASATTFSLTTGGTDCAWTATKSATWITSVSPTTSTNSRVVTVNFAANTTLAQRTATITFRETGLTGGPSAVATIVQAPGEAPTSCVTVATIANPVPIGGQVGALALTADSPSCAWTTSVDRPWLHVFPPSGTGSTTLSFRVYPNFGSQARTGTITVGGRTLNITQNASTETAARRFIRLLYFSYFGRGASDTEVDAWIATGASRGVLAGSFLRAPEFNLAGRFVAGLYVGILNRDPEFSGWIFQRDAISSGAGLQCALATNFVNSAEFQLQHPSLTNEGFIQVLYRQVLGREAGTSEIATHLPSLLANGRGQLACNFLNAPEFRQRNDARLTAFLLYATLLLRDSSLEERTNVRNALTANPGALESLLDSFANSAEVNILLQ